MDNSTFCSEVSVQNSWPNYPPGENFLISLGNKSRIILPKYSFSNIPFRIDTPISPQENFNYMIPSGINSPIPKGTNYTILSGGIFDFS